MLTIRDDEVRTLALTVMKKRGAENMTAAIKLALQNEINRARDEIPIMDRVDAMIAKARAKATGPQLPSTEDVRDSMWDR